MEPTSMHLAQHVRCPAADAYAFASDPANLPAWAAGLGDGIAQVDGRWLVSTPAGEVVLEPAPPNPYGVLDHDVVLPDGTRVHNPVRVLPLGDDCEVVFTLRRQPDMTDEDLARDADAVRADLLNLKRLLER